ncbi:30S ribosomal protein S1, partial [Streptomyces sp. NPDC093982]
NDWLEGYETQREAWEGQYAEAQQRFEQHQAQAIKSREADAAAKNAGTEPVPTTQTGNTLNTHWYASYALGSNETLPNVRH